MPGKWSDDFFEAHGRDLLVNYVYARFEPDEGQRAKLLYLWVIDLGERWLRFTARRRPPL